VLPILELLWESTTTERNKSLVASSLLAGMMVGQVGGGVLGDAPSVGRVKALALVMALQVVASVAAAFCQSYVSLTACRFVLGIGAGGVYPLAAALSAEQQQQGGQRCASNSAESLHRVVLTFSMQGVGFLAVPIVTVILLSVTTNLQVVWRMILALGCVPGLVLMLLQCWMHRGTGHHRRTLVPTIDQHEEEIQNDGHSDPDPNVNGARLDSAQPDAPEPNASNHYGVWDAIRHEEDLVRKMVGTAGTWFLFDVLFYGNTLFQPIVIQAAFGSVDADANDSDPIQVLRQTAINSLILTLIAVPGYAVAGMALGSKTFGCSQTPRYVMLQGFLAMSLLYLTIGLGWKDLRRFPSVLLTLYAFTFFFANYGPNTTTFCLPSLVYSPECRTTLNGLSAAAGKLGAWTGATLFSPAADALGNATVLILCSLISIVAFFMTVFYVPRPPAVEPVHPRHVNDDDEEGTARIRSSDLRNTASADEEGGIV
jgi:MFS transporter, PHS family, inorganic phosphate transporter